MTSKISACGVIEAPTLITVSFVSVVQPVNTNTKVNNVNPNLINFFMFFSFNFFYLFFEQSSRLSFV